MISFLALILALYAQQLLAVDTVVDLGYAKYRGVEKNDGISMWMGMRYARSVSRIDGMRFAAPQDPLNETDIANAIQFGPTCIGTTTNLKTEFGGNHSEDCLFANVFAPTKATEDSLLPVYIFIQGGGFNYNGNANYNATDLIHAANDSIVVVNFNYRVGPYGFLASKEIAEDESLSLNNGLKDQRQLLRWVQSHISKFGGDPGHVTLGGASAGAGSVVLQLTAYGGRDENLFHAAAAESQPFPTIRNVSESQFAYDALLEKTPCKDLVCLKDLDAVTFQNAVKALKMPFPGGRNPPLWFWNPTLDYDFIRNFTYYEINAGHFVQVPTIFGDDTNEGAVFTPISVNSKQRAEQFVADQFVNLNKTLGYALEDDFPGPVDRFSSRWQTVAANMYGHIRYTCPSLNVSAALAKNGSVPTYLYRWNYGTAHHVAELGPIWNGGTNAAAFFVQNYWQSFIRTYNPNTYKTEFATAGGTIVMSPTWEQRMDSGANRMLFGNDNMVRMEEVPLEEQERCDMIYGLGMQLQQ
ncbi:alpha/beta-hydrolase [Lojkania enalia]|uniref:Carboxylic ester hydrolase n=1 Tax=Lojkania enalia TaxID=147567 RepID=A0A9P4N6C8_9PLEO|nr:alpha/beta-hydrolase [Didymosphaeria enalia]